MSGPEIVLQNGGALKLYYAYTEVEVQINMAFVYLKCSFINNTAAVESGWFTYPASLENGCTVYGCDITWNGKTFRSAIIDPAQQPMEVDEALSSVSKPHFNTKLFSMPFHGMPGNSETIVELRFVQELSFNAENGNYSLHLPMTVPTLFPGRTYKDNIHYRVLLAPGTDNGGWESDSHNLSVENVDGNIVTLSGSGESNKDLLISYHAWSEKVTGSAIVQSKGGSFAVFLQPPSVTKATPIPRNIVFLVDQSLSMSAGTVMASAKRALLSALDQLSAVDHFSICSFDDETTWFRGGHDTHLVTEDSITEAKAWVNGIQPKGLTDIFTPYKKAIEILQRTGSKEHKSSGSFGKPKIAPSLGQETSVPIIVLITDGAVGEDQDKQIMRCVQDSRSTRDKVPVRSFTYGIGPYVNRVFLHQLADAGNGYSSVCLNADNIESSMKSFLSKTTRPVLSSISLDLPGIEVELFPTSIPDLAVGAPLVVCGRFHNGSFPSEFTVSGFGPDRTSTKVHIQASGTERAPVHALVEKSRLDVLVGKWYVAAKEKEKEYYKQEAIKASIESGIPCVFTQGIVYEATTAIDVSGLEKPPSGITAPSKVRYTDEFNADNNMNRQKRHGMSGGAVIGVTTCALLATGIGATYAFGNVSATQSGASVLQAMQTLGSNGFEFFGSAAESGWDAVSAVDWGGVGNEIGGSLAGAYEAVSSAAPDILNGAAELGGSAISTVGEVGQDALNAIQDSDIAGGAADVVQSVGGGLESAGGAIIEGAGSAVETIGDFAGSAFEEVGGFVGNAVSYGGEAVSFIGEQAGEAASFIGEHAGEAASFIGEHAGEAIEMVGGAVESIGENVAPCCDGIFSIIGDFLK